MLTKLLIEVKPTGGFDYVEFFILNLVSTHEDLTTDLIIQAVIQQTNSQTLGDKVMTLTERLEKKGLEKE